MLPGISPIVETRASWRQAKPLPFNKLGLDWGLRSLYRNFIQSKTMGEALKNLKQKPEMQKDISRLSAACCAPQKYDLPQTVPQPAVVSNA